MRRAWATKCTPGKISLVFLFPRCFYVIRALSLSLFLPPPFAPFFLHVVPPSRSSALFSVMAHVPTSPSPPERRPHVTASSSVNSTSI